MSILSILGQEASAAGFAGLSPAWQLGVYSVAVGIASLAGGAFTASLRLSHRKLQIALSFVGGTMLGVGVLHLLPHAIILALESSEGGGASSHGALHASIDGVVLSVVVGFMVMFLLERFFQFHQHETPGHAKQVSELGWVGAAIGLTLHSILEGVALAAAVLAGATHDKIVALAGFSTCVVILLHKPFDGLTVTTLVRAAGRPAAFAHAVNALFALVVPVGAAMLWFGVSENGADILPYALAFSAGTFICIATSDLLPELQFHRHDRLGLSAALLLGLGLAAAIARIESSVVQSGEHAGHDHSGHDHADHDHADHDHADHAP